jgi:hypothetical protein
LGGRFINGSGAWRGEVAKPYLELAFSVMPGLVPGIHVLAPRKTWMAGTKPGHDEKGELFARD